MDVFLDEMIMYYLSTIQIFKISFYEIYLSPQVISLFRSVFCNNVALFVKKHVLLHEKYFLYSQGNDIRYYGEYSNTPLEGTNFGIKHSSISTHPGSSLDSSMVILSLLSDKHVNKVNSNVIRQNKRQCMNYTNDVHDKLTVMCISSDEWKVRKIIRPNKRTRRYIPDFDVLQTVHLMDTSIPCVKQLGCTCMYTAVYGLSCVHALTVATTFEPCWAYITHNDVSVRWLKIYYLYSLIIIQISMKYLKSTQIPVTGSWVQQSHKMESP